MVSFLIRLIGWLRPTSRKQREGYGWVEPGNAVTRAIYERELALPAMASDAPITVALPAATVAEIEAAAAAEEAAARAFEAAREAALPSPQRPPEPALPAANAAVTTSGTEAPTGEPITGSSSAEAAPGAPAGAPGDGAPAQAA